MNEIKATTLQWVVNTLLRCELYYLGNISQPSRLGGPAAQKSFFTSSRSCSHFLVLSFTNILRKDFTCLDRCPSHIWVALCENTLTSLWVPKIFLQYRLWLIALHQFIFMWFKYLNAHTVNGTVAGKTGHYRTAHLEQPEPAGTTKLWPSDPSFF